jgi:hypothetical protein
MRWYLTYRLSYRDLVEMMAARGSKTPDRRMTASGRACLAIDAAQAAAGETSRAMRLALLVSAIRRS